jgi:hypothetical protein
LAVQDVRASREVLAMSTLNEPIAKRIGKLVRMFGSPSEEEANVALLKLRVLLTQEKLSFNDLATVIENANGEIEEFKYSDTDAEIIFKRGVEKGRVEEARKQQAPPDFYEADGHPRWYEMSKYSKEKLTQLKPGFETEFVRDTPEKMLSYGRPKSAKQARWILTFFVRAGGTVPAGILFDGERVS